MNYAMKLDLPSEPYLKSIMVRLWYTCACLSCSAAELFYYRTNALLGMVFAVNVLIGLYFLLQLTMPAQLIALSAGSRSEVVCGSVNG